MQSPLGYSLPHKYLHIEAGYGTYHQLSNDGCGRRLNGDVPSGYDIQMRRTESRLLLLRVKPDRVWYNMSLTEFEVALLPTALDSPRCRRER